MKLPDDKISNKKQKQKEATKPTDLPYVKRVIYVGWKHKKDSQSDYRYMGAVIGPKIKVNVNGNEDYSLQVLKEIFLKEYINESNEDYFKNCKVDIGTSNNTVIDSFEHEGKMYGFWEFVSVKNMRTSNHILHLYLLTRKMHDLVLTDEFPDCASITIDKRNETISKSLNLTEKKEDSATNNILKKVDLNSMQSSEVNLKGQKAKKDKYFNLITESGTIAERKVVIENKPVNLGLKVQPSIEIKNLDFKSDNEILEQKSEKKVEEKSKKSESKQPLEISNSTVSSDSDDFPRPAKQQSQHYMDVSIKFIEESKIEFSDTILGKGGQGVVYKGKYLGSIVAIKSMQKSTHDKLVLREILLLDKIRHPNVINIMAASVTRTQIHIVMEYFKSDSLFDIIFESQVKNKYCLNTQNKNKICYKVATALTYLHLQPTPILHRDVKPSNILVNEQFDVKVCDLGLAKSKLANVSLQSTRVDTMRGTYLYMAPEILLHQKEATKAADVWAFACTAVELYSEKAIMDVENYFNGWLCAKNHLDVKYVPSVESLPLNLQKKFSECFNYDPKLRPEMLELVNLFNDSEYN